MPPAWSSWRPAAENGGAGADHCRAFGDGGVKIIAHANGQCVHGGELFFEGLKSIVKWPECDALALKVRLGGRNSHQTAQTYITELTDGGTQCFNLVQGYAGFGIFSREIDLYTDIQWRQVGGALGVKALGDAHAVDAVKPVKMAGNIAGFV